MEQAKEIEQLSVRFRGKNGSMMGSNVKHNSSAVSDNFTIKDGKRGSVNTLMN